MATNLIGDGWKHAALCQQIAINNCKTFLSFFFSNALFFIISCTFISFSFFCVRVFGYRILFCRQFITFGNVELWKKKKTNHKLCDMPRATTYQPLFTHVIRPVMDKTQQHTHSSPTGQPSIFFFNYYYYYFVRQWISYFFKSAAVN